MKYTCLLCGKDCPRCGRKLMFEPEHIDCFRHHKKPNHYCERCGIEFHPWGYVRCLVCHTKGDVFALFGYNAKELGETYYCAHCNTWHKNTDRLDFKVR